MILLDLMKDNSKFGVVILLLLSVITIFISPAVDLQPTALRALQLANMVFAMLALAGTTWSARVRVPLNPATTPFACDCVWAPTPALIDLNCVRLC